MSEPENLLFQEHPYSGKVYHLEADPSLNLDLSEIRQNLSGASVSVSGDFKFEDDDGVIIPEVFQPEKGKKPNEAKIDQVSGFNQRGINGIVGYVNHNDPRTISFQDKEVFIMESVRTLFAIFEVRGEHYLSMLGARSVVNSVLELISEILEGFGFRTRNIEISHGGFEEIVDNMVDSLKTTTVSGYSSPNIDKKVIRGSDYEGEPEYEREARIGNVSGHQFGTEVVGDTGIKTVQIAGDGLVRSYSSVPLIDYIDMVANYVLDAQIQIQSSLASFGAEDSRALND